MARDVTPTPTPNPNAIRFGLGPDALGPQSRSYANAEAAAGVAWAEALFALPGVQSLFGVNDFLTVTKDPDAP
ncbi:MAG: NifU N-terminal domain-containing protein, partial [Planctomycetota bacterium]